MRWVFFTLLFTAGSIHCLEDQINEVIIGSSTKPPINLDTNLRKALLKALVELENEEKDKHERNIRNDYVNLLSHLNTKDKSVEKASASALSYYTQSDPVNMTITVKKTTSKPIHTVVVQKSKGSLHKTIYGGEDLDLSESPEQFIASASSSFNSKTQNSENPKNVLGGAQLNSITSRVKTKKTKYQTATTPRPTTSTEESEAKVENLQFFSAPLVAAFTVHQDEKGLPRRVVPIYNQVGIISTTTEKHLLNQIKKKEQDNLQKEVLKQQKELEERQEEELRKRQHKLEEEIRLLKKLKEEQERIIRDQRITYEQKLFEQQRRLINEQARLFNNVQPFIPITSTPAPVFHSSNQLNSNNNFRGNSDTLVSIQPSVGFLQPTLHSHLPINAQILPVRNAIDFRTPFNRNFGQVSVQNSLSSEPRPLIPSQPLFLNRPFNSVVPITNFVHNPIVPLGNLAQNSVVPLVNTAQNVDFFQSLPSTAPHTNFRQVSIAHNTFPTIQSLPFVTQQGPPFRSLETSSQPHGTRTLRQESGTGNFVNNRFNSQESNSNFFRDQRFNRPSLPSQQNQNSQSFRSNFGASSNPTPSQYNTLQYSVDEPQLNQRLNNLLYNSGIGRGRQQEDINIVSKVLSLNQFGGLGTQNFNDNRITRGTANWRVV